MRTELVLIHPRGFFIWSGSWIQLIEKYSSALFSLISLIGKMCYGKTAVKCSFVLDIVEQEQRSKVWNQQK